MTTDLGGQARGAAKWSLLTEVLAKVIAPVTQLLLARILAPEAFGIVATVVMVTSFAEMFADAGFQKYLVQKQFADQESLYRSANVAFWTSMSIAVTLLVAIVFLRDQLAELVGSPELGIPIAVASLSIPLAVVVGTQQALFRRAFVYKKLLPIRLVFALIPLAVSVPLALNGFGYWSLIIGALVAALFNAVTMTAVSPWKPQLFFSFSLLKQMFAFSGWTLLETLAIWATLWSGTFIVGNLLTQTELGLYRQPIVVVNSLFAIVTSATTPILFAALSRLQNDPENYRLFFFRFQFAVSVAVLPVAVGAFFYRDFFMDLLFGPQWDAAALMFGAWALVSGFSIVLSHYCSEIFRSLGKPKVSLLSQCLYMAVMIPAVYLAASHSFEMLVVVNASVRLVAIAISQILTKIVADIGFLQVLRNLYAPLISAILMGAFAAWLAGLASGRWLGSIGGIVACAIVYGLLCLSFPRTRAMLFGWARAAIEKLK